MAIRLRGKHSYQVDVTHQGQRVRETFTTHEAAVAWEALAKAALSLGRPVPAPGAVLGGADGPGGALTLGDAFKGTFQKYWAGGRSEATMALNGDLMLRHFGKQCPVAGIGTREIDAWVEALRAQGNSNGTINRKLSVLSKVLGFARSRGALRGGELPVMDRQREGAGRVRTVSPEEEARVLAYLRQCGKLDAHDAVVVLKRTGLRCGELLRLTRADVDLEGKVVRVWETKADLPRAVPIGRDVLEVLRARCLVPAPARVFGAYTYRELREAWDCARRHLGLAKDPQFTLHALRHTFCTSLIRSGVPLPVVKQLAGHRRIETTMRYIHVTGQDAAQAVALFDAEPSVVRHASGLGD